MNKEVLCVSCHNGNSEAYVPTIVWTEVTEEGQPASDKTRHVPGSQTVGRGHRTLQLNPTLAVTTFGWDIEALGIMTYFDDP